LEAKDSSTMNNGVMKNKIYYICIILICILKMSILVPVNGKLNDVASNYKSHHDNNE